ncbi:hypothetical protein BSFA1_73850 (plasmid) [Burkholderia sp. SFA1]|uniref:DUF3331 domain-containing protein n=1 Tax=unclassified Caballeronia TaxID=2646786 RepID=UPI001F31C549|nr:MULTISPECIES: DUF3331 domain-containing protein [unclassified Caballeronia]MCE4547152.1 DUF3331 domain-containing protein [Caballeronia sp. PC1]MCE4572374.1 DUF3331 domain-containing protein [Caballeronia sp. CLC5]BBQ02257.1 hypothetical protein BSFA1_73850 [Burkholderia sp. SFA1]
MADAAIALDPWAQTIFRLTSLNDGVNVEAPSRRRPFAQAHDSRVAVKLIERPSTTTVTIEWRDSTRCCYGDQVWRAMRARTAGVCAMSGGAIAPGDHVYAPNPRPVPGNMGAMILASVLDQTPL